MGNRISLSTVCYFSSQHLLATNENFQICMFEKPSFAAPPLAHLRTFIWSENNRGSARFSNAAQRNPWNVIQ